jgi:hypothetical protein
MASLSFELNDLFMLLVLEQLVAVSFPSKPDFVQKRLSIKSNLVSLVKGSLRADPNPQRLVLFVLEWHHAMVILLF